MSSISLEEDWVLKYRREQETGGERYEPKLVQKLTAISRFIPLRITGISSRLCWG